MSIMCYPLEPDEPPRPPPVKVRPAPMVRTMNRTAQSFFEGETSECYYLVLIFVAGVLLLALSDAMRR